MRFDIKKLSKLDWVAMFISALCSNAAFVLLILLVEWNEQAKESSEESL